MSRRHIPNVNASLIHEARMLFQQFFNGRQENRYSLKIAEANARSRTASVCTHPALKCGLCMGTPKDAHFIINGQSVCLEHEMKARGASNRPRFPGE